MSRGWVRVGMVGGAAGTGLDETLKGGRVVVVGVACWEAGVRGCGEWVVVLEGFFVAGRGFQGDCVAAADAAAAAADAAALSPHPRE